jgi:hypothetical protein
MIGPAERPADRRGRTGRNAPVAAALSSSMQPSAIASVRAESTALLLPPCMQSFVPTAGRHLLWTRSTSRERHIGRRLHASQGEHLVAAADIPAWRGRQDPSGAFLQTAAASRQLVWVGVVDGRRSVMPGAQDDVGDVRGVVRRVDPRLDRVQLDRQVGAE